MSLEQLFGLRGKVAVITGGTGVLGSVMARGLAGAGARVGILGRRFDRASDVAAQIEQTGGEAMPLRADVLIREELVRCEQAVRDRWGVADILVSAGQICGGHP